MFRHLFGGSFFTVFESQSMFHFVKINATTIVSFAVGKQVDGLTPAPSAGVMPRQAES